MAPIVRSGTSAAVIAFVSVLGASSPAGAVPAFARKYEIGCATCHTVFPRLTPQGKAFREAGYRFPGQKDEDLIEEDPVPLGREAHKKVFPEAIWPASISRLSPLAVVVKSAVTAWERDAPASADFTGLEPTFDVYAFSSIGERFAVFGKVQLNGPECTNCHTSFAVTVNDLLPHSTLKVGRFQPEYFSFHQQPLFEFHDVLGPERTVGSNAWNLGNDYGVELAGTMFEHGRYVVGVLEGASNQPSSAKDLYVHVAWTFGGTERSLAVGGLAYKGWADLASNDEIGAPVAVDDSFVAGALDASLVFDEVNLFGGGVFQRHSNPTATDQNILVERYFAGLRYTPWPWLAPQVLFDYYNSELPGDYTYQLRGRIELLVRANTKLRFDVAARRPIGEKLELRSAAMLFDVGF